MHLSMVLKVLEPDKHLQSVINFWLLSTGWKVTLDGQTIETYESITALHLLRIMESN